MKDPKLVRKYRILDQDIAAYDDNFRGFATQSNRLFIPSQANRNIKPAKLDALKARQAALEAPDEVFGIVKTHHRDFIEGLQFNLDNRFNSPAHSIKDWGLIGLIRRDTRPDTHRKKLVEDRISQYDEIYTAIFKWIHQLPPEEISSLLAATHEMRAIIQNEKQELDHFMKDLTPDQLKDLRGKMQACTHNLDHWIIKLEELTAKSGTKEKAHDRGLSDTIPTNIESYRNALKEHGVDLDKILSWHEAEVAKSRSECLNIANSLDIPEAPVTTMAQVNDILLKYAGPASSPEEMFERAKEYVTRATAAAREYVWLPPDADCMPTPMAAHLKATYPWGAGGSTDLSKRPFVGRFMLNDDNYKAVTDGWIKINCSHEVHPGHYTQFLRCHLDPLPETFKRGAKYTCLTEGMCIRTEKLFEYIFAEDKFYPLFTAYRRHHTTVRIMVDLWLYYYGKTIGDALALYTTELGFDPETARKQVRAHETGKGYFTTYYYGYKKVAEWEKLYSYDKYQYTEILFSASRVSLDTFRRILELNPADRYSLLHEFASLNQFR